MTMPRGAAVEVQGLPAVMKAMQALEPDLAKAANKEIRQIIQPIQKDAKAKAPRRTGQMRAGYRIGKLRPTANAFGWKVWNRTKQGVILEFAGSQSGGSSPQGESLIRNLTEKYGPPARFGWAAYEQHGRDVEPRIADAVERIVTDFNARHGG